MRYEESRERSSYDASSGYSGSRYSAGGGWNAGSAGSSAWGNYVEPPPLPMGYIGAQSGGRGGGYGGPGLAGGGGYAGGYAGGYSRALCLELGLGFSLGVVLGPRRRRVSRWRRRRWRQGRLQRLRRRAPLKVFPKFQSHNPCHPGSLAEAVRDSQRRGNLSPRARASPGFRPSSRIRRRRSRAGLDGLAAADGAGGHGAGVHGQVHGRPFGLGAVGLADGEVVADGHALARDLDH
jgi:hypothetical protein